MRPIRNLFVVLLLALPVPWALAAPGEAAPAAGSLQTVVLEVPGMSCRFCPVTVRKALKKLPGVVEVEADLDSRTATVRYDPARVSVEEMTAATARAGYESRPRGGP